MCNDSYLDREKQPPVMAPTFQIKLPSHSFRSRSQLFPVVNSRAWRINSAVHIIVTFIADAQASAAAQVEAAVRASAAAQVQAAVRASAAAQVAAAVRASAAAQAEAAARALAAVRRCLLSATERLSVASTCRSQCCRSKRKTKRKWVHLALTSIRR